MACGCGPAQAAARSGAASACRSSRGWPRNRCAFCGWNWSKTLAPPTPDRRDKGNPRKTPRDDSDKPDRRKEPRASTTDPQARVMKGPDGGFRPSYNAQFSTDTASQIIVGVAVTNEGTDWDQLPPMTAQWHERYGRHPAETLADRGYTRFEAIERTSALGTDRKSTPLNSTHHYIS